MICFLHLFVLSPCLRTPITCVFSESDVWWWCGCGLGVVLGSTGSCLWCDLVVGVLMSWVHVFSVISVVLVSVFVWCSEFEGCSWFVFPVLLWCEWWREGWSWVVVLCACRHLFLSFVPLLSFVSLSPPSWWTISVVDFVSLLERGRIGRGLLFRRLVRHRRWCPQR